MFAGRSFESGELFRKLCVSAFKQCDVDGSGSIDMKELHIALLILYDKINSIIPVHYDIPDKQEASFHGLSGQSRGLHCSLLAIAVDVYVLIPDTEVLTPLRHRWGLC